MHKQLIINGLRYFYSYGDETYPGTYFQSIDLIKLNNLVNKEARFSYTGKIETLSIALTEEEASIAVISNQYFIRPIKSSSWAADDIRKKDILHHAFDFRMYPDNIIEQLIRRYPNEVKEIPANQYILSILSGRI